MKICINIFTVKCTYVVINTSIDKMTISSYIRQKTYLYSALFMLTDNVPDC